MTSVSGELRFFREEGVDRVLLALDHAEDPDDFFESVDQIAQDSELTLSRDWQFGTDVPTLVLGETVGNAKSIYQYLGQMSPVEASDRRLWTYLSLVEFGAYLEGRWPLEDAGDTESESWKNRVRSRWMVVNNNRESIVRNELSRLWWAAHLTHDPSHSWPLSSETSEELAYLGVLLGKEDAFTPITERDIAFSPSVLFPFLDHIRHGSVPVKTKIVREMAKELTAVMGYREVIGLESEEIESVMVEIRKITNERFSAAR